MYKETETAYGALLTPPWDNFIAASIENYGYYCNVEQKFTNQLCALLAATQDEHGLILDIGAHIGTMSLAMAHGIASGETKHTVLAFEPQHNSYAMLCGNMLRNDYLYNTVVPVNGAVIPNDKYSPMLVDIPYITNATPFNSGAVSLEQWQHFEEDTPYMKVQQAPLAEYLERLALDHKRILYAKIDVEGMELDIVNDILSHSRPVILAECNTPEAYNKFYENVTEFEHEAGYRMHWMCEPYYMSSVKNENIWKREIWSVNVMMVPKWFRDTYSFQTDAPKFTDASSVLDAINLTKGVVLNGKDQEQVQA